MVILQNWYIHFSCADFVKGTVKKSVVVLFVPYATDSLGRRHKLTNQNRFKYLEIKFQNGVSNGVFLCGSNFEPVSLIDLSLLSPRIVPNTHEMRRFFLVVTRDKLKCSTPLRSEIFSLSSCGPISILGITLRRYYLGYLLEQFNLSHLNLYI